MSAEIRVPSMGESITEATVGNWLKKEGDRVALGEPVVELETEKANVEVSAETDGVLERITKKTGDTVKTGDIVGVIADGARPRPRERREEPRERAELPEQRLEAPPEAAADRVAAPAERGAGEVEATPVARRLAEERGLDLARVKGSGRGGKVTREDVEAFAEPAGADTGAAPEAVAPEQREGAHAEGAREEVAHAATAEGVAPKPEAEPERARERPMPAEAAPQTARPAEPVAPAPRGTRDQDEDRVRLTRRRQTIARRLVEAHQTAVMTTTFNEIDMSQVMELRKRRREGFKERFGVDLGFMSFFVRAVIAALKAYPRVNSSLDGEDLVLKRYYDIGIAVASEEGLVVPVLKNADRLSFAEVERAIAGMVQRTRDRKLTLEELHGGTFTITNGGVFGSLMSTPILNPPQVGILGMHRAFERPVAVESKIEIRPMMYVALTYDHRVVDGADAVRFLIHVKGMIEDPGRLLVES